METRQRLGPSPHVSGNSRISSTPASRKLHRHPLTTDTSLSRTVFFVPLGEALTCPLNSTRNQYAIRTLLNIAKSTSYSDLLTYVGLKTVEHRRYSHALSLFYKCLYNMGPNNSKEMFLFRNDLRGCFCKLNQPKSRFMHRSYHYITSRLWNNLPDYVRRAPSLNDPCWMRST